LTSLIAAYLAWIVSQTGLTAPHHPTIHSVTPAEMAQRYGAPESNALEFQALYSHEDRKIYLPEDWRSDSLKNRSALLHELVHHVQRENNVQAPCKAALERQAYDLQMKWLREQGVDDAYAIVGTNELTIYMVSTCRDDS
jgi:methionine-rich copper-binding protein CopC